MLKKKKEKIGEKCNGSGDIERKLDEYLAFQKNLFKAFRTKERREKKYEKRTQKKYYKKG